MTAPIIDSQVHVWLPESEERPWPPGGQQRAVSMHRVTPISGEQLLRELDEAGVDRAVLVPPFFEGHRNDYALRCAQEAPDRFRVMARVDLAAQAESALREVVADPLVPGVRLLFLPADGGAVSDGAADWLWPIAEDLDLPVMVFAPGQTAAITEVARQHPRLRLALDHLGLPPGVCDQQVAPHIDALVAAAELENICVKASAVPNASTQPYPFVGLHPYLARVLAAFGPERVFWGSDLSRLRGSYPDLVRLFSVDLGLTATERELVMGAALARWLAWP